MKLLLRSYLPSTSSGGVCARQALTGQVDRGVDVAVDGEATGLALKHPLIGRQLGFH